MADEQNAALADRPVRSGTAPGIKIDLKKVYCPRCRRLVRGQVKPVAGGTEVNCPRCGQLLWAWNGIHWKQPRVEAW